MSRLNDLYGKLRPGSPVSSEELAAMFDEGYHFKHVDTIFARVFGKA